MNESATIELLTTDIPQRPPAGHVGPPPLRRLVLATLAELGGTATVGQLVKATGILAIDLAPTIRRLSADGDVRLKSTE